MPRPTALSGFPEWLPGQRLAEQLVLDTIRSVFELHGFVPVQTRAVEPLDQLLRKGETSKEVYVLRRLQADPDAGEGTDAGLGLHFDLTVPFARYVLENEGRLSFPFRRYQIQPVWRGERPQDGRFREFLQADVDVVGSGELPARADAELAAVALAALAALPIPPVEMRINNRRLVEGFCLGLGMWPESVPDALRTLDKLAKVGPAGVRAELEEGVLGCTASQSSALLQLARVSGRAAVVRDAVHRLGVSDPLMDQGVSELTAVLDAVPAGGRHRVVADLSITRGLDYYTGTVYETVLVGDEGYGSICSGGRYEELAAGGSAPHPGVGLSIGVSRLLARLFRDDRLRASRPTPTCVLVAVVDEDSRGASEAVAAALRARGIATLVSPTAARFGRQIRTADRAGIPFVWFPGSGDSADADDPLRGQVKDIRSGEQVDADAATWAPPAGDLHPHLVGEQSVGGQSVGGESVGEQSAGGS